MKKIRQKLMAASAAVFIGMTAGVESAFAGGGDGTGGFADIVGNIETSISNLPGLITGVSYMMGIVLGVLGVLKIKDHVENPGQTPLQQGAIRLAAGGGLFALPMVYQAMFSTIGEGEAISVPAVGAIQMTTN